MAKPAVVGEFCSCPMGYRRTIPCTGVCSTEPKEFKDSFVGVSSTERLGIELIHMTAKPPGLDREGKLKALHSVSALRSEHQLVLAQQKVDGKSNEITAVPLLLKLLNLKGAVVTLDAMGTRRRWQRRFSKPRGLCVALKGNQGNSANK